MLPLSGTVRATGPSEVEGRYSHRGQRAYAPRQIMSILIYAYSRGVFSSRQIEQRCREDLGFMYIAGELPELPGVERFPEGPGRVFPGRFQTDGATGDGAGTGVVGTRESGRVQVQGEQLEAQGDELRAAEAARAGIVRGDRSLDPTGGRSGRGRGPGLQERTGYELPEDLRDKKQRLKKIRETKQALEAREAELRPGQKIEDKKQISFADHDARIMKDKGGFEYAYNAQISVDGKSQVIVGQHVSQQANDAREVAPALDEMEETSGGLPEKLSLDNGSIRGRTCRKCRIGRWRPTSRRTGDAGKGRPGGERPSPGEGGLSLRRGAGWLSLPRGAAADLEDRSRPGAAGVSGRCRGVRLVPVLSSLLPVEVGGGAHDHERRQGAVGRAMNERMSQPESRVIYARRKTIVEPVFGQIKNTGFRGFGVRGKEKVAGEFSLVCVAHNLKKIVFAALRGEVCPEFGTRAAWA